MSIRNLIPYLKQLTDHAEADGWKWHAVLEDEIVTLQLRRGQEAYAVMILPVERDTP